MTMEGFSIALTVESDLYTATKWVDLGINSRVFDLTNGAQDVTINDFEVIDTCPRIAETWECVRSELPLDPLFLDGFEGP
jgi:serine/threonine-protein kinase